MCGAVGIRNIRVIHHVCAYWARRGGCRETLETRKLVSHRQDRCTYIPPSVGVFKEGRVFP